LKKLLFVSLFVLFLAACGGESEDSGNDSSASDAPAEETSAPEPVEEEVTFEAASEGDKITDDYGTYTIEKVGEPEQATYETGPITFDLNKVMLATFVPNEESKSFFDGQEELNLAITLIESENTSDDTISFHPFSANVTTNTKGQYESQMYLNEGESEHIGKVVQEFRIPHNLGDEDLSEVTELTFTFDAPAKDSMSTGEDVTVPVSFE